MLCNQEHMCNNECENNCKKDHKKCSRGKLSDDFMFCPLRKTDSTVTLSYVKYELATDDNVKEGKEPYKKMQKTEIELQANDFLERFKAEFPKYSQHEVEFWYLNAVQNAAFSNMPKHAMASVTDFAENVVIEPRHAVSEEHFHKKQIALLGTVTKICTPIPVECENGEAQTNVEHLLSQMTLSDNK